MIHVAQFPSPSAAEGHLHLRTVVRGTEQDQEQTLEFHTDGGVITGKYHAAQPPAGHPRRAVIWVGGAGGGLDGPAAGLYPEMCRRLQRDGIAGLRIHYRHPNHLTACVQDTLLAISFLRREGVERIALAGHSFGGAVVISTGACSRSVTAVVAMSTQVRGTDLVSELSPRPLLLIHGTDDEVLSSHASELVYEAAREPKELKLLPGARHGLDSARDQVLELLTAWLEKVG